MKKPSVRALRKVPSGISGLDEITFGGFPAGRSTLLCGDAGCGKTLFGMHFLVRGILDHGEAGVFISFEERARDLADNVASFGFDLNALIAAKKLAIDYVRIERSEIEETGAYDLEGLFVRIGYAIDSVGARRVVLDTVEALFGGLSDTGVLRAELRRLFGWLKERGVTSIITGERGEGTLTRYGIEEYVSDCVIVLDHRTTKQVSTRRLHVVKYRGSAHGTNEYPFLIDEHGISVLPITSTGLQHAAGTQRIPTGVPRLDAMLGGKGYYRGSSVLVSGSAGTGKTSLAAHFVDAACARGETCLYFAFEESPSQIVRNMRSIGIDLQPHVDRGLLHIRASRPTAFGLEAHLLDVQNTVRRVKPSVAVFDPLSNMVAVGSFEEVRDMLVRLIDGLKAGGTTALFTALTPNTNANSDTEIGISSLVDTWLLLREIESEGERTRGLYVLKSRGMAHSNQIREFVLTDHGVELIDVYTGSGAVLTGSARLAQEARDRDAALLRQEEIDRRTRQFESTQASIEAQIAELKRKLELERADYDAATKGALLRSRKIEQDRLAVAARRKADRIQIRNGSKTART